MSPTAVLALPTSDSTIFGPTTVSVALPVPLLPAVVAGATSPATPFSPASLFLRPLTSNLPGDADSFQSALVPTAAKDPVDERLNAVTSLAPFVDDMTLTGWNSEDLTPVPLRG
jgi:hypothetical protein